MIIRKHETADIARLTELFDDKGLQEFFTKKEIDIYYNGHSCGRLAARYLAKQIILRQFSPDQNFLEISILNDRYGRPFVEFTGHMDEVIKSADMLNVHLSLSHSRKKVAAFVLFEYLCSTNANERSDAPDHTLGNQG